MKYYLYISDAKVDMLLPQIPHNIKKKIATEFGIDLKFFVAKRTTECEENSDRIVRLEAVLSYIREFGNLGTIAAPNEFIEDSLAMYCASIPLSQGGDLVYWTGRQMRTVIGLGGSAHHIVGAVPAPVQGWGSFKPYILGGLGVKLWGDEVKGKGDFEVEKLLAVLTDWENGASENLRFMAKRLITQNDRTRTFILGTPLYVAKED